MSSSPTEETALIVASRQGYVDVVDVLLTHGARIDKTDSHGFTALGAAFASTTMINEMSRDRTVTRLLIAEGEKASQKIAAKSLVSHLDAQLHRNDMRTVAVNVRESLATYEVAGAWSLMGEMLLRGQSPKAGAEAAAALIKATRLEPRVAVHRVRLVKAYLLLRDYPRARIAAFNALAALCDDDPNMRCFETILRHLVKSKVAEVPGAVSSRAALAAPRQASAVACAYCQLSVLPDHAGPCPYCACDVRGPGVGVHPWMDERLAPALKATASLVLRPSCWSCGSCVKILVHCYACEAAAYCSAECKRRAWLRCHRVECPNSTATYGLSTPVKREGREP